VEYLASNLPKPKVLEANHSAESLREEGVKRKERRKKKENNRENHTYSIYKSMKDVRKV
jgi:hypothetical protein